MQSPVVRERLWQAARREANQILADFNLTHTDEPVDIYWICQELGIRVFEADLADEVSGYIKQEHPQSLPIIVLNRNEFETRKRFTTAHELGHFVDRRNAQADGLEDGIYGFIDYRSPKERDIHELFADEFAGALLMPGDQVRKLQEKGVSTADMAAHFDVSVPAMHVRLNRLAQNPDVV